MLLMSRSKMLSRHVRSLCVCACACACATMVSYLQTLHTTRRYQALVVLTPPSCCRGRCTLVMQWVPIGPRPCPKAPSQATSLLSMALTSHPFSLTHQTTDPCSSAQISMEDLHGVKAHHSLAPMQSSRGLTKQETKMLSGLLLCASVMGRAMVLIW